MLKHMLNGNASAATAPAGGELSGATAPRHARSSSPDGGSRDPLSTTHRQQRHHQPALQPQPQQAQPSTQQQSPQLPSPPPQRQLRQPSDSVDNHLSSRLRHTVVSEPEYQNTRHRSSPTSEFCRSVPPAKSVRSLENVVVGVGEPESRMRRPALDAAWMVASARSRPSVPSHDSSGSIGASFAFMTAQQQLATPAHLLNHRDGTSNLSAIGAVSPAFAPIANGPIKPLANGGLHIAKRSPIGSATSTNVAARHATAASDSSADIGNDENEEAGAYGDCGREATFGDGVKEILTSLGLLCLISLLLALLSLIFLLKISPVTAADLKDLMRAEQFTIISPDEYVTVYEVTLALCSLTLSLNLCCLLVCSVQFLFAVKLARSSLNGDRLVNILSIIITRQSSIGTVANSYDIAPAFGLYLLTLRIELSFSNSGSLNKIFDFQIWLFFFFTCI